MTAKIVPPPISTNISLEVAQAEYNRFIDTMDIDGDETAMNEEDLTEYKKHKRRLIKAMQDGRLLVNEEGELVYTLKYHDTINNPVLTFHQRTGADLMASDGKGKNQDAQKMYCIVGSIVKRNPAEISKLYGIDIKIVESIFVLLMV